MVRIWYEEISLFVRRAIFRKKSGAPEGIYRTGLIYTPSGHALQIRMHVIRMTYCYIRF